MRGNLTLLLLGFILFANSLPIVSLAQEEETEYSLGTVKSISSGRIIITEYDYDTEEEINVTYTITPNVKLDNVKSLKEIAVGDDVWIDYVIKDGKKIAVGIEVRKPSYEQTDYSEEETEY